MTRKPKGKTPWFKWLTWLLVTVAVVGLARVLATRADDVAVQQRLFCAYLVGLAPMVVIAFLREAGIIRLFERDGWPLVALIAASVFLDVGGNVFLNWAFDIPRHEATRVPLFLMGMLFLVPFGSELNDEGDDIDDELAAAAKWDPMGGVLYDPVEKPDK